MIVTIKRDAFIKALKIVTLAAAKANKNGLHPEAVSISVEHGLVRLACRKGTWDGFRSITTKIQAGLVMTADDEPETATVAVEAICLLKLVEACKNGEDVFLEFPEKATGRLLVKDALFRFSIETFDPKGVWASTIQDQECAIAAPGLLKTVRRVMFAASTEPERPVLTAVHFDGHVSATDGFRIAFWPESFAGVNGLIPAGALRMASAVFRGVDPMIWMDKNRVVFSDGVTSIESSLIEGNFPNVEEIIPKSKSLVVSFATADLRKALNALCAASGSAFLGDQRALRMMIDEKSATIRKANNEEIGFETSIDAEIVSMDTSVKQVSLPFEIGFKADFLLDVCKQAGARVLLLANAKNTPTIWRPAHETDPWFSLVMPMHFA